MYTDYEFQSRKRLRLKNYDYSTHGYYFVTLCTENRDCLFGDIVNKIMVLNPAGNMIQSVWEGLSNLYPSVKVDSLIIMANHIHAVLVIENHLKANNKTGSFNLSSNLSLPTLMRNIKSYTTTLYIKGVKTENWLAFQNRLWQRSYHEHIIRNDRNLERIRQYIEDNPLKWDLDRNNPVFKKTNK